MVEMNADACEIVVLVKPHHHYPFCSLLHLSPLDASCRFQGRTEIITNCQSPRFMAQFTMTYIFEEVQSLRFEVYDADSSYKTSDATHLILAKQDFQGEFPFHI